MQALRDVILRIGRLAEDFPEIVAIDVNPLLARGPGQGVVALDARSGSRRRTEVRCEHPGEAASGPRDRRLAVGSGSSAGVVSEADVASLPAPAQRYLRFMHVIGSPRVWSFRVGRTGRFRRGPREPWRSIEAWQYDTSVEIARMFYMRIRFFGAPVLGRDTYVRGSGRMLIRPFDLFTAQDATGPELDIGELVTFLNDAISSPRRCCWGRPFRGARPATMPSTSP